MNPAHTVFVTGASSGIGEAVARRFARGGFRLVLAARRLDRLEVLAGSLGVPCHVIELDVRDRGAVFAAVEGLPAEFAAVSVLVNNAGLSLGLEGAQEANIEEWETMIATNVNGLVACTRAVLPGMVRRGRGHVINLGSVAGSYPYPGGNVYGATKAFVAQFSLNLRADLHGTGLRVTDIEPGMVESEFSKVRFRGDEDRASAVYRGMKPLTPEDIAETIAWCALLPDHVNVNRLEVMSVMQSFSPFAVSRS